MNDVQMYAEVRQVLAELELLSHGTVTNYAASGGGSGPGTKDPTGESHPPHLHWRAEWEAAEDNARREYILERARSELRDSRKRSLTTIALETETVAQLEERVVDEGARWTVDEIALHCRVTPTFVRRARLKGGADVVTGIKPDEVKAQPPRDKLEHARELLANNLTVRQIEMLTGVPKSTIQDMKKRAA